MAEPGYKVTITQDFYSSLPGPRPRTRQRSIGRYIYNIYNYPDVYINIYNIYNISTEMFRPKQWEDLTRIQPQMLAPGTVISAKVILENIWFIVAKIFVIILKIFVQVEVAPSDKEAREDFNKFVQEMVQQNSNNGEEEMRLQGGICSAVQG